MTVTGTDRVLYEMHGDTLGVMPQGRGAPSPGSGATAIGAGSSITVTGGGLQVVNVVDLEDYVKGVLPS